MQSSATSTLCITAPATAAIYAERDRQKKTFVLPAVRDMNRGQFLLELPRRRSEVYRLEDQLSYVYSRLQDTQSLLVNERTGAPVEPRLMSEGRISFSDHIIALNKPIGKLAEAIGELNMTKAKLKAVSAAREADHLKLEETLEALNVVTKNDGAVMKGELADMQENMNSQRVGFEALLEEFKESSETEVAKKDEELTALKEAQDASTKLLANELDKAKVAKAEESARLLQCQEEMTALKIDQEDRSGNREKAAKAIGRLLCGSVTVIGAVLLRGFLGKKDA